MNNSKLVIVICLSVFIFLFLPNIIEAQNITEPQTNITEESNDSWYDTHWGGDTGNTTFVEPVEDEDTPIIETPDSGLCTTSYCTSGTIVLSIGLTFYITKNKNIINNKKCEKKTRWKIWKKDKQE